MLKSVVIPVLVILGCLLGGYVFFREHDRYDPVATGGDNNPNEEKLQAEEAKSMQQRAMSRARAGAMAGAIILALALLPNALTVKLWNVLGVVSGALAGGIGAGASACLARYAILNNSPMEFFGPGIIACFWVPVGMLVAVFATQSHNLTTRLVYGMLAGIVITIATSVGGGIAFVQQRYRDSMPPATLNQSLILFFGAGVVLAVMIFLLEELRPKAKSLTAESKPE